MAQPFELEILTPVRRVFKGPVTSVVAPAETGYLGVLANHAPMFVTLTNGKVIYRDPAGSPTTLWVKGNGFLEVYKNHVTVLTGEVGGNDHA